MNSAHGHYGPDSLPLLKEKDWILIAMLILQSSSNFNSESSFIGSLFTISKGYLTFKFNSHSEMIMQEKGTPAYNINVCMVD